MVAQSKPFSNVQLELLKVYARQVSDEDVLAIRQILATYFAEKAIKLADAVWDEKGWKEEDTLHLSQQHHRKKATKP